MAVKERAIGGNWEEGKKMNETLNEHNTHYNFLSDKIGIGWINK